MALLELHDVHSYYGRVHVLKGIRLTVEEGEIVTLIGSNGAGKTTTLRTLSGLVQAREGKIIFAGTDITRRKADEIVRLGLAHVPEGRRIFTTLTVEENLILGRYLWARDTRELQKRLAEVYDLFPRLKERRHQLGGSLSGGEQQMLAIGRALMAEPKLLALDEPSMGLAPMLVRQIFQIIEEVSRRGVAILLVEQNARRALELAHRAYVLDVGRIVLEGKAADLARDPRVQAAYLGGTPV
ncbi:MAG: ABC transporter ATP-binding protein [Clostridiales bacterium]|nr:ABC transporter ATP-binding protein [Clostridiales bacterium]